MGVGQRYLPMTALPIGEQATVIAIATKGLIRRRLLDLGLVPGTVVKAVRKSPGGDPIAFGIRGALIALRSEESSQIWVHPWNWQRGVSWD